MRTLELTIYPPAGPLPDWEDALERERYWVDRGKEQTGKAAKRLTDAELAAEYWRGHADHWQANEYNDADLAAEGCTWPDYWKVIDRRKAALHRFATTPHHDEETP